MLESWSPASAAMKLAVCACALALAAPWAAGDALAGAETLAALDAWLRGLDPRGGLALEAVELAAEPGRGRGVRALRPLARGDRVARVPLRALVGVEHAAAAFARDGWAQRELDGLGDLDLLAALVLRERADPARSAWAPLWQAIPQNLTTAALFLCPPQLEALAATAPSFAAEIRALQADLASRWRESDLLRAVAPTPAAFVTAVALVQSRVFSVAVKSPHDGRWHHPACLVPFADLLNTGPQDSLNADCATDRDSVVFECFATKEISAGTFLHVPYASLSTRHAWLSYGFVDASMAATRDDAALAEAFAIVQRTACEEECYSDEN